MSIGIEATSSPHRFTNGWFDGICQSAQAQGQCLQFTMMEAAVGFKYHKGGYLLDGQLDDEAPKGQWVHFIALILNLHCILMSVVLLMTPVKIR